MTFYLFYEIFLHVALVITAPYFVYKMIVHGKYSSGIPERFGSIAKEKLDALRGGKGVVWFHAVSVGETKAALTLLKSFRKKYPSYKILFSTVTLTGNGIAKKDGKGLIDALIYMPLDYSWVAGKVIGLIDPKAFIVVEKEYWPNTVRILSERNVPIIVVNGTVSERSYGRYKLAGFFFRRVFNSFAFFCAQTEEDRERAVSLGLSSDRSAVTGNLKFDMRPASVDAEKIEALKKAFGLKEGVKLLVAGSTHEGEEETILKVFKSLRKEMKGLRLVIAPRHPERFGDVEDLVLKHGFGCVKRTVGGGLDTDVCLLNTIGELSAAYSLSTVPFVGGSLVGGIGGHNILEPAFYSKPVIYGIHVKNYKILAKTFEDAGAGFRAEGEEGLFSIIRKLLVDEPFRAAAGEKAHEFVLKNAGIADKTLELSEKAMGLKA